MPRRPLKVAVAVVAICTTAVAQEAMPTFRSGTRLVEVTFVATADGKPVANLEQADITIADNGTTRPVAFFQYEGGASAVGASGAQQALPPNVFTNRVEVTGGPPRHITAILLDSVNTPPDAQMRARKQVIDYLKEIDTNTRVAIFHLANELTILHDFSSDTESLRERVRASSSLSPVAALDRAQARRQTQQMLEDLREASVDNNGLVQALSSMLAADERSEQFLRRNRASLSMSALEAIARHMSAIPGRKNLVWITGGVPMMAIIGTGMGPGGDIINLTPLFYRTAEKVAQSGVALYITDARGVRVGVNQTTRFIPNNPSQVILDNRQFSDDPLPGMMLLASQTGGRVTNTNELTEGLHRAREDQQAVYSAAFYVPDDGDGKWHSLRISTKRPGVTLLHRAGYLSERAAQPVEPLSSEQWRELLASPFGESAISLLSRYERKGDQISLDVLVDTGSLYFQRADDKVSAGFEICIAEMTVDGRFRTFIDAAKINVSERRWSEMQKQGIPYAKSWMLKPDAAKVRVAVRDRSSGQKGMVDVPLARPAR
jgi:VWFA-related protein